MIFEQPPANNSIALEPNSNLVITRSRTLLLTRRGNIVHINVHYNTSRLSV